MKESGNETGLDEGAKEKRKMVEKENKYNEVSTKKVQHRKVRGQTMLIDL